MDFSDSFLTGLQVWGTLGGLGTLSLIAAKNKLREWGVQLPLPHFRHNILSEKIEIEGVMPTVETEMEELLTVTEQEKLTIQNIIVQGGQLAVCSDGYHVLLGSTTDPDPLTPAQAAYWSTCYDDVVGYYNQRVADGDKQLATLYAINRVLQQGSNKQLPSFSMQTGIPLLYDAKGEWHFYHLDKDLHLLCAGVTGGGKGNLIQALTLLALSFGPEKVRLVVVDPKGGLDYTFCNRLSHADLYYKDYAHLTEGIKSVHAEMESRNEYCFKYDARNLGELPAIAARPPLLLFVCDEIASLSQEQQSIVADIARKGRAVGVIVIAATQYPTAEAIGTQIRANLPNRFVFRLSSAQEISVALGIQQNDRGGKYLPHLITKDTPGVVIWRSNGTEVLGRVFNVTDVWRQQIIQQLAERWPRQLTENVIPFPPTVSRAFPVGVSQEIAQIEPEIGPEETAQGNGERETAIAFLLEKGFSARQIVALLRGKSEINLKQIQAVQAKLAEMK